MIAETPQRSRRCPDNPLIYLVPETSRKQAETPETFLQVIDLEAETETETSEYPLRGYRAGAHARACRAALKGRAAQ